MLNGLLKSKYLSKDVKLIMYKQLIRPLFLYASPCWFVINLESSYLIEQIRKKEREILRKCCNLHLHRDLITKKYICSKILYNEARINRIDREIVKRNLKFVENSKIHPRHVVSEIFNGNVRDNEKYKPIDYLNRLLNENRLYENDKFLIFNKEKIKQNEYVYVTKQNENDI